MAGGLCLQLLAAQGVEIFAHIAQIGSIPDRAFDPLAPERPGSGFPVLDAAAGEAMRAEIAAAAAAGDSVGGVVECAVTGPARRSRRADVRRLENRLAQALFAIPAVKGVEFGSGFAGAALRGSENNDPYCMKNGAVCTRTNHAGGILGGLSTGMPIVFRAAFKPTPSIALPQQTVRLSDGAPVTLELRGRHDPCIVQRLCPVWRLRLRSRCWTPHWRHKYGSFERPAAGYRRAGCAARGPVPPPDGRGRAHCGREAGAGPGGPAAEREQEIRARLAELAAPALQPGMQAWFEALRAASRDWQESSPAPGASLRCGLLGEHLRHSYSPEIHAMLGAYSYDLFEVPPEGLADFLHGAAWDG